MACQAHGGAAQGGPNRPTRKRGRLGRLRSPEAPSVRSVVRRTSGPIRESRGEHDPARPRPDRRRRVEFLYTRGGIGTPANVRARPIAVVLSTRPAVGPSPQRVDARGLGLGAQRAARPFSHGRPVGCPDYVPYGSPVYVLSRQLRHSHWQYGFAHAASDVSFTR
ncbi:MAG: hypothetical protein H6Q33_5286 [Deltaproteobacteria bacterium]|nr:hypothetical protein [Deltaproteobacteria bacterium]